MKGDNNGIDLNKELEKFKSSFIVFSIVSLVLILLSYSLIVALIVHLRNKHKRENTTVEYVAPTPMYNDDIEEVQDSYQHLPGSRHHYQTIGYNNRR